MSMPLKIQTFPAKKRHHYIVLLHDHVQKDDHFTWLNGVRNTLSGVTHDFDSSFLHGYTGEFNETALAALRNSPHVKSISEDGFIPEEYAVADQHDAPWGISRISEDVQSDNQSATALDFEYKYNLTPVDVYIVDGGIRITHKEFSGRATWGRTFGDWKEMYADENGHGTHCAGIVGSNTFGVSKDVHLIAVKVSGTPKESDENNSGQGGYHSNRLQGLEWVQRQAQLTGNPSVVNLSWGWPANDEPNEDPMDKAVTSLTVYGIHVAVAAGNRGWDVSKTTPARVPPAITVAASNIDGYRCKFSNYGSGVDIFAPGKYITSTFNTSDTATKVLSGTSMAAPHVAGLVAYLIKLYGNRTPAEMKILLDILSLKGALKDTEEHPLKAVNKLARNDVDNQQWQPHPKPTIDDGNPRTVSIQIRKRTIVTVFGTDNSGNRHYIFAKVCDKNGKKLKDTKGEENAQFVGKQVGSLKVQNEDDSPVTVWGPFEHETVLTLVFDDGGDNAYAGEIIGYQMKEFTDNILKTSISLIPFEKGYLPSQTGQHRPVVDVIVNVTRMTLSNVPYL